jgi:Ser/Thr protein kinase RdoA (MazF antagonist)
LGQPYRRPAWPGLLPARPIYGPAHPDLANAIQVALGITAPVFALQNAGGSSPTFRIDDEAPLFVKLVAPERWRELREAELIARWLVDQGAPAIAARDGHPPQLDSGEFVVVYPFAAGRPPNPGQDAKAVGAGVGQLHAALKSHPHRTDWQERTDRRFDRLVAIRASLASGELAAGPQPEELMRLAADPSISFLPGAHGSGPPRPLHGDLNIFNIVIEDGAARFIDFEDAVHSVLSVENDLAVACERVILVQEPDDGAAAAGIDALLDAYREAGGDAINRHALPDVLIGLSLRSLCTLALIDRRGSDAAEWAKFFTLIEAAQQRRKVFG